MHQEEPSLFNGRSMTCVEGMRDDFAACDAMANSDTQGVIY